MAATYNTRIYNTNQFHYNHDTGEFMADASSLGLSPGIAPDVNGGLREKYILLLSHKTSNVVKFQLITEDQACWIYACPTVTGPNGPVTVTIFND